MHRLAEQFVYPMRTFSSVIKVKHDVRQVLKQYKKLIFFSTVLGFERIILREVLYCFSSADTVLFLYYLFDKRLRSTYSGSNNRLNTVSLWRL